MSELSLLRYKLCGLSCALVLPAGGTPAQSTCRGRRWTEEGAPAPWTSWRISPWLTAPEVVALRHQAGPTSGTTALRGASTETRMTAGSAAAPPLYLRRGGTRGTVIVPVDPHRAKGTMTPSSAACWTARPGGGEGTEGLVDRTRTVTLPRKAAPEGRPAIVTTAGRPATVQRRRTLCRRTVSGRRSGTAGRTRPWTGTALRSLTDQSYTRPRSPPWGLSVTPAPTRGRPTRCNRGAERRGTGTETWWVTCSRKKDFLPPRQERASNAWLTTNPMKSPQTFCLGCQNLMLVGW